MNLADPSLITALDKGQALESLKSLPNQIDQAWKEASEIKTEDWTRLSRIRSEGIAEITKINTQSTHARTRVIFISNPILKTIANYSYGIQALVDIVKAPEDIARFDYVLVVAHNEVEIKDINRRRELVKEIYRITNEFPREEMYGLVSQMRRSSISIPSNIAEGYKRKSLGDYVRFLNIADGSAAELETQIIISRDIYKEIDFSKAESLLEEVQKMLVVLIKKLNTK